MKNKTLLFIAILIIVLNIETSNRILQSEAFYRTKSVGDKLWSTIINDVPLGEKNSVFMYLGNDYIRGSLLDFSGSIPYGVARKISNTDDFPIPTADDALIIKLLCNRNVSRPAVIHWSVQKDPIPLSHIHAWEVNNGAIVDVSKREQIRLQMQAKMEGCNPKL